MIGCVTPTSLSRSAEMERFLRGMHAASLHGIPVLGVNMGRVGFMSEIDSRDALEGIEWYLEGNGRIDERAMLKATSWWRDGRIIARIE